MDDARMMTEIMNIRCDSPKVNMQRYIKIKYNSTKGSTDCSFPFTVYIIHFIQKGLPQAARVCISKLLSCLLLKCLQNP